MSADITLAISNIFFIFLYFLFYKWRVLYYNVKVKGDLTKRYSIFSDWMCSL